MRKFFAILVYSIILLLIGRNLPQLPRFTVLSSPKQYPDEIKADIQALLKKAPGNYSVYYANLNQEGSFGIDEKEIFTAASVNKVPIVAAVYYLENKGKINFDDNITLQKEDIQDYGTGSIRYAAPGTVYSIKTLAKLALKQSDNTAAHILANQVGMPVIQDLIDSWGMRQTDMENNKSSVYDMYLLFKKIYAGQITTKGKTEEFLSFMQDTDIEDRLSKGIPADATIYHKTGDAIGSLHDVGIIKHGDQLFYLGVMTSDIGDKEDQAKQTIATIVKHIFDFYQQRQ